MKKKNRTIYGHLSHEINSKDYTIEDRVLKAGDKVILYEPTGSVFGGHPEVKVSNAFSVTMDGRFMSKKSDKIFLMDDFVGKYFSIV